jgi:hypothetical protein
MDKNTYTYRPPDTAPQDKILILAIRFNEHNIFDVPPDAITETLGYRKSETGEFVFVGWCWTHDHFTTGKGTVVGWREGVIQGPVDFKLEGQ